MENFDRSKVASMVTSHQKWLDGIDGGKRADFTGANLSEISFKELDLSEAVFNEADLRGADFSGATLREAKFNDANLSGANLEGADLREAFFNRAILKRANLEEAFLRHALLKKANLEEANLEGADLLWAKLPEANLSGANLIGVKLYDADLSGAFLRNANLVGANLEEANLRDADLKGAVLDGVNLKRAKLDGANLEGADLSGVKGLLSPSDFIDKLEKCSDGVLVYKIFGILYPSPSNWEIKEGSVIEEVANFDRATPCGSGVNVTTKEWVRKRKEILQGKEVWQCLIRWEWLAGVCIPYSTDGRFRCEKLELIKIVTGEELGWK